MASPLRRRPAGSRVLKLVTDPVSEAVAVFGREVAEKLNLGGEPEEQLRAPFETLLRVLGGRLGLRTIPYGEVRLKELRARPDFAVDVAAVRIGYVELKRPGHGVPGTWKRPAKSDKAQWEKLKALPNVLYTDGVTWARFSYGELASPIVTLDGDLEDRRRPLSPVGSGFEALIQDFLLWEPERPRSLLDLVKTVAGLCRLLRDEVVAILADASGDVAHEELTILQEAWRELLFPNLDDNGFADAYAQTVTFAFLLARIDGIPFEATPVHEIAKLLGKKHSLMGRALAVLTDSDATEELRMIATLRRVIGSVDWATIDHGQTDIHADLYERFLANYDPALRRRSGSYYTPQDVAGTVVDFVDEVLRDRFEFTWGLAADDVVVVDPAMGTGTFLVEVLRSVAETIESKQGRGARAARLRQFFQERLVGFEIQAAPYAVAELRLHQTMKTRFKAELPKSEVRFLTDALEDPVYRQSKIIPGTRVIDNARREANRIKREVPVMVVIGNPPHVENTRGRAPWIEQRRKVPLPPGALIDRPSLDEFRLAGPGSGRYESDLYGLPWCYWRWALWKAFEAHPAEPQGVVAFVTPASFIRGRSFRGMREYLRRTCDEGWIFELSPEGNHPKQDTRIFGPDVGRQLCIAVFARYGTGDPSQQADVYRISLTGTSREKIARLREISLADQGWEKCRRDWTEPFLAPGQAGWEQNPDLKDLFPESSRGVTTGRTWVYAPDTDTLTRRWRRFLRAGKALRREMLPESRDRTIETVVAPLPGFPPAKASLADEAGPPMPPIQVAYRAFDRQWLIPDSRLMVMPRPPLWYVRSTHQIFLTEQSTQPIESGPGVAFTHLIPDLHHYNGRSGRVIPLYCGPSTEHPNLTPGLCAFLSSTLGLKIEPVDIFAYVAGAVAHDGYTRRFHQQLQHPGVRLPITRDPALWTAAVEVGRQVLWLHTFGQRGRKRGYTSFRDYVEAASPKVLTEISADPDTLPEFIDYDSDTQTLIVGDGHIHPVEQRVWDYDVGGMRVLRHWFNYRSAGQRYRRRSSPLDDDSVRGWTPRLTDELLEIVAVLEGCAALEARQADLLQRICAGPLVTTAVMQANGILPPANFHKLTAGPDRRNPTLF